MRRQKALVIHDDPEIVDELSEVSELLGHEYVWARSQAEVRRLLADNDFHYILLDLEIPVRSECGVSRVRNGVNLLDELRANERAERVPVIVIVRSSIATLRLAVWIMQHGAQDVIEKPLPAEGYTLDKAIKKTTARWYAGRQRLLISRPVCSSEPTPFRGGEMVFYPDHVELCGVRIISDAGSGQSMLMLHVLREKRSDGRFRSVGAGAIARKIEADGVGTITGCAATIRRNITERLRKQSNILCGAHDVLDNDEQGYHLRSWITVRVVEDGASQPAQACGTAARTAAPVAPGTP